MANTGSLLSLLVICSLLTTDVTAVAIKDFYKFGLDARDAALQPTLDGSSPPIILPSPFNFFGVFYNIIYVSEVLVSHWYNYSYSRDVSSSV